MLRRERIAIHGGTYATAGVQPERPETSRDRSPRPILGVRRDINGLNQIRDRNRHRHAVDNRLLVPAAFEVILLFGVVTRPAADDGAQLPFMLIVQTLVKKRVEGVSLGHRVALVIEIAHRPDEHRIWYPRERPD